MNSEDGQPLYEGDNYFAFAKDRKSEKWSFAFQDLGLLKNHGVVVSSDIIKAFKSKQRGIQWCNRQDTPFPNPTAVIFNSQREINEIRKFIGSSNTTVNTWAYIFCNNIHTESKFAAYLDRGVWSFDCVADCKKAGYDVISYDEFAKNTDAPEYIVTSEDGVRMYHGDPFVLYDLERLEVRKENGLRTYNYPLRGWHKQPLIFHSRTAAQDRADSDKKIKPVEVSLDRSDRATVSHGNYVTITSGCGVVMLSEYDLAKINEAVSRFKNQF